MRARHEPCPSFPQAARPIGLGRRPAGKSGMAPPGVVHVDPLADDPFGPEAVGQVVQVDLISRRADNDP